MASMVTLQFCSFLQRMIQKPQKEHPLKAYARASLKNHEGKEREKKEQKRTSKVQDQTTLYCSASPVKTARTNKLLELIIPSHGQYTQTEPPAKVLVICDTSENTGSRRFTSHKRQDRILLLFRFKPYLNEGCKLADKTLGVWNGLSNIGSGWENTVGDPSFTAHRKVKRSLATGKLQGKLHFCCLLCLPI